MGLTSNGVGYSEMSDGLEEGMDSQGPFAKKPYLVAWGDRFKFLQWLAGTSTRSGSSSGGTWIRGVPQSYPEVPNIFASSASIRGEGNFYTTEPITWDKAIVTVTYRPLDWQGDSGNIDPATPIPFASQELDFLSEWNDIPNSSVRFQSDNSVVNTKVSKRSLIIRMVITWHLYPVIPMGLCASYADSVNDATFLGCDRGTVLFEGPKTIRETDSAGNSVQKVTFSFKWRAEDWNKVIRTDGIHYDFVVDKTNSTIYPFAYMNYSALLLPGVNA